MAINKIDNSTYLDSDWQNEIISKNLLKKGFENIELEKQQDDFYIIKSGSYLESNGLIYEVDSDQYIGYLEFDGFGDLVYDMVITSDGSKIYASSADDTVKKIDVETATVDWTFTGHTDIVYNVVLSSDDSKLYTSGSDNTIKEIDVISGTENWSYEDTGTILTMELSTTEEELYIGGNGYIRKFDISSQSADWTFSAFTGYVSALVVGDTSVYIGTTGDDVIEVNSSTGTAGWTNSEFTDSIYSGTINSDYSKLYMGSFDGKLKSINPSTGSTNWTEDLVGRIHQTTINTDDTKLYVSVESGYIKRIDIATVTTDWTYDVSPDVNPRALLLDHGHKLYYAGDTTDTIRAIDIDGKRFDGKFIKFSDVEPYVFSIGHNLPSYDYSRKGYYDAEGNRYLYFHKDGSFENLEKSSKIWYEESTGSTYFYVDGSGFTEEI